MTTLTRDRAINGLPMYSEDGNTIVEVFFDPVEMVDSAENILKSLWSNKHKDRLRAEMERNGSVVVAGYTGDLPRSNLIGQKIQCRGYHMLHDTENVYGAQFKHSIGVYIRF